MIPWHRKFAIWAIFSMLIALGSALTDVFGLSIGHAGAFVAAVYAGIAVVCGLVGLVLEWRRPEPEHRVIDHNGAIFTTTDREVADGVASRWAREVAVTARIALSDREVADRVYEELKRRARNAARGGLA